MDKCIKKICGWTGTDEQKKEVPNEKLSKGAIPVNDLVCPKCGCRSFHEVGDSSKLSGPKKQRGYIQFPEGLEAFIALAFVACVGWLVVEAVSWLFSHIDISWV